MNLIKRELLLLETSRFFVSPHRHTEVSPSQVNHHRDRDTSTMSDYMYEREDDGSPLWTKGPVSVSRFRRWLFPALTATVVLALIIAVGASNVKTSSRLSSAEQTVSNLTNIVQSLNASLQHAQETAGEVHRLQFAVENHRQQLTSGLSLLITHTHLLAPPCHNLFVYLTSHLSAAVSEALKQLSVVESLSKSVAALKCSLEHIINNSSAVDGCCPVNWNAFGSSCYFFSSSPLSWDESRTWCETHDSHLVILNTDQEWDFVTRLSVPHYFWVGLRLQKAGRWEWVNQTPYVLQRRRWEPGQPDGWTDHGLGPEGEDCAHLHSSGRLNDLHCSIGLRFICQRHSQRS
ncbi:hypothetical protein INR49_007364 [Caranx melampygus]|nr:hypothetical protein INR49_007364 [Caranx melampygus]